MFQIALLMALNFSLIAEKPASKTEKFFKNIDGEWKVESVYLNGEKTTVQAEDGDVEIKEKKFFTQGTARLKFSSVDPDTDPIVVDFVPLNEGKEGDMKLEGILQIKEDKMTIVISLTPGNRPTSLDQPTEAGIIHVVLTRKKMK
ncbi:MAG: TIGR03067 domain-containing protein [Zavarzinella sp.]